MSWSTDPRGQVFHPEDVESLTREGTIIFCEIPNMRRVHKRRIYQSSEDEYRDLPLPSSPNSSLPNTSTSISADHYLTIPDYIISRETLSYLGFTDAAAETIWGRWNNLGDDQGREIDGGPITFESMFRAHIYGDGADTSATDDDSAWYNMMDTVGINQTQQDAIMTPACKEMRMMETCKYWLLDTISANYEALEDIQATSLRRVMAARNANASGVS